MIVRPGEVDAFAESLQATAAVQVPLARLWTIWAQAAPRLVGAPEQAAGLEAALQTLAAQGIVELPVAAWDTSTVPPLPRSVRIPAARRPARTRPWIRHPWRAELGWAASLPALSDDRFADLVAINKWLARADSGAILPMRYRSAEIFGDEKRLEGLMRTNLFGDRRLSLEMLRCRRLPAPLPAVSVGPGDDVLVVENSDTYWAAVEALSSLSGHAVGAVAWGAGRAFHLQVTALAVDVGGRGPVRGTVWYWGDLDPVGVAIARDAAAAAQAAGGPLVRPAATLWRAMAKRPQQETGHINWSNVDASEWFGIDLWRDLESVRAAKARVAQESVPIELINAWACPEGCQ